MKRNVFSVVVLCLVILSLVFSIIAFAAKDNKGDLGPQGVPGIQGDTGGVGKDGKSAFELAVANGFEGETEAEFFGWLRYGKVVKDVSLEGWYEHTTEGWTFSTGAYIDLDKISETDIQTVTVTLYQGDEILAVTEGTGIVALLGESSGLTPITCPFSISGFSDDYWTNTVNNLTYSSTPDKVKFVIGTQEFGIKLELVGRAVSESESAESASEAKDLADTNKYFPGVLPLTYWEPFMNPSASTHWLPMTLFVDGSEFDIATITSIRFVLERDEETVIDGFIGTEKLDDFFAANKENSGGTNFYRDARGYEWLQGYEGDARYWTTLTNNVDWLDAGIYQYTVIITSNNGIDHTYKVSSNKFDWSTGAIASMLDGLKSDAVNEITLNARERAYYNSVAGFVGFNDLYDAIVDKYSALINFAAAPDEIANYVTLAKSALDTMETEISTVMDVAVANRAVNGLDAAVVVFKSELLGSTYTNAEAIARALDAITYLIHA